MGEIEKSLTIIKPRNFGYCLEIFSLLEDWLKSDFSMTIPAHIMHVPEQIIREHYENISHLPVYENTIKTFLNSEYGIVLRLYSGKNIVNRIRKAIGNTDPKKAEPGTIRAVFSRDSLEISAKEVRYLNNVIHASSSKEDAKREIDLWKDYL